MSWINSFESGSWRDFKIEILQKLYSPSGQFQKGKYWFRGQASSSHRLESSFDRWFNKISSKTSKRRTDVVKELFSAFKEEACWFPEYEKVNDTEAKIMALGRHHGLPTRQLDWSESPYIAAFFAFADCDLMKLRNDSVAVWALNRDSRVWRRGVELKSIDRSGNVRLKYQSGGFTILKTSSANLEDHLGKVKQKNGETAALWKFIMPDSIAKEALADLDSMGINYASLYSGIEGAVLAARMRVMLMDC